MSIERWLPWRKKTEKKRERIYPPTVMYDLEFGATLEKEGLESLIRNGFPREFFYLATKSLASAPEQQLLFLKEALEVLLADELSPMKLMQELLNLNQSLPQHTSVKAAKLAQFNRLGSEQWQEDFRVVMRESVESHPEFIPVLIAHTPLFALPDYIKMYRDKEKPVLFFFNFEWVKEGKEVVGYKFILGPSSFEVDLINESQLIELQGQQITLFDDTIRDDETIDQITDYFLRVIGVKEATVRAITVLKKSSHPRLEQ